VYRDKRIYWRKDGTVIREEAQQSAKPEVASGMQRSSWQADVGLCEQIVHAILLVAGVENVRVLGLYRRVS
jgi:hypothetical protein